MWRTGSCYIRELASLEARPIAGSSFGQPINPVFSPDGQSLAFFSNADSTLKRIAVTGGAAVTICPADNPFGMSWGADGIVFGQGPKGILRVSANGGKPEVIVSGKDDEVIHGPQMLAGGRAVLFTLANGSAPDRWEKAQVVVQSLGSGERKVVVEGGADARYLSTGHIVYALGGILLAVPFDVDALETTGGPVPIVEGVRRAAAARTGTAQFSVSDSGFLVYVPGPASASAGAQDLALVDRSSGVLQPLKLISGTYQHARVSPDGTRIVFGTDDGKEASVYTYTLGGGTSMQRLTFGGNNRFPIWAADGKRIAFQSDRDGDRAIFWQAADGSGTAERLTKADEGTTHTPESWSPAGDRFLFSITKQSNVSLWVFSLQDRKATQIPGSQCHS